MPSIITDYFFPLSIENASGRTRCRHFRTYYCADRSYQAPIKPLSDAKTRPLGPASSASTHCGPFSLLPSPFSSLKRGHVTRVHLGLLDGFNQIQSFKLRFIPAQTTPVPRSASSRSLASSETCQCRSQRHLAGCLGRRDPSAQ